LLNKPGGLGKIGVGKKDAALGSLTGNLELVTRLNGGRKDVYFRTSMKGEKKYRGE